MSSHSSVEKRVIFDKFSDQSVSFSRGFDEFHYSGLRNLPTNALRGELEQKTKYDPINYSGLFKNSQTIETKTIFKISDGKYYPSYLAEPKKLEKADHDYIISKYDFGINYTDDFIGKLIDVLASKDLFKKTIIIIHGIHGEDLGEHGYYSHYDVYDSEVKTVFIVYIPNKSKVSKRIVQQVQGIDLAPTIIDYANIQADDSFMGKSLRPIIETGNTISTDAFFERVPPYESGIIKYITNVTPFYKTKLQQLFKKAPPHDVGVRTNEWKLIHRRYRKYEEMIGIWHMLSEKKTKIPEYELYNLKLDPFEKKNVFDKFPDIAKKLKEKILNWEKTSLAQ